MIRIVHRLTAIIALFAMLYLSVTGSAMQILDLYAILTHAPDNNPTVISIDEGRNGNADFAVLSNADLTAKPLPSGLDARQAFLTALAGLHTRRPGVQPRFVELRMKGDSLVGQAATGPFTMGPDGFRQDIVAVDINSGAPVPAVAAQPSEPVPALRQSLKEWHRFWSRRDVPGVYLELACGIILWIMIITGLWFYFRLVTARGELGHRNWFWYAGDWWRTLHRGVAVVAAIFIVLIAFSGTWLGFESVWHTFRNVPTADVSSPMTDAQVIQAAQAALNDLRADEPQRPVKVIRVRVYSNIPQGVIVTGGPETRQLVYDVTTGKRESLSEEGYPPSAFPFGLQMHEDMKHFHSGYMFGLTGRWIDLFTGLSIFYLSVSGLVMYFEQWQSRRKTGRREFIWL